MLVDRRPKKEGRRVIDSTEKEEEELRTIHGPADAAFPTKEDAETGSFQET